MNKKQRTSTLLLASHLHLFVRSADVSRLLLWCPPPTSVWNQPPGLPPKSFHVLLLKVVMAKTPKNWASFFSFLPRVFFIFLPSCLPYISLPSYFFSFLFSDPSVNSPCTLRACMVRSCGSVYRRKEHHRGKSVLQSQKKASSDTTVPNGERPVGGPAAVGPGETSSSGKIKGTP